jgi:hypothetical protein
MKHIHHIIPKHQGGTDDPTNLIELSIEEHAEAHRLLYEKYGRKEDYIAWKGLSSSIGKESLFLEKSSLGGKKNTKAKTIEHRRKLSESNKKSHPKGMTKIGGVQKHSDEVKKRISESMKGHTNSKNHSSDEYRKKQSEAMKIAWLKRKNRV